MIEASGLTMHYGPVVALDEASFEVHVGEVVGLLGPNGAGKSTTMKILTTYLCPTSGTAKVAGHDILEEPLEVRRKIGYLPEVIPLYMDMEVRDYLRFVGKARGLSGSALNTRIEWVVEHCGLRAVFRKVMRDLSRGFRQRAGLAQALIHDPEVVILDEATSGLDPHQILGIRKLIRMLAETKTVILSTHILQQAQDTSDRLVIISHGRIVGDGTMEELRRSVKKRGSITLSVAAEHKEAKAKLVNLAEGGEVSFEEQSGEYARFTIRADDTAALLPQIGRLARNEGWELAGLTERPTTLEEIFLALTESEHTVEKRTDAA